MRPIDADALSAFVNDLRSALHKEQSKFMGMTDIEFNTRDYMLLIFQYAIDNAPTVNTKSFANVTFDKEELNRIVEERVIEPIKNGELVIKKERPRGECKTCKYYHPYYERSEPRGDGYCVIARMTPEGMTTINCNDEFSCSDYQKRERRAPDV